MKATFTTGEIASICSISSRTAQTWCDSGMLRHHLVPGTKHRRVMHNDLKEFMEANGMGDLWTAYEAQERFQEALRA